MSYKITFVLETNGSNLDPFLFKIGFRRSMEREGYKIGNITKIKRIPEEDTK